VRAEGKKGFKGKKPQVSSPWVPEHLDRTDLLKRGARRTLYEFEFAIERAESTGTYGKPAAYWQRFRDAIHTGNTIQKMAQKRALVAATLIATSSSEFLTQDVEDADSSVRNTDTVSHPPGTREAQEYVRDRKLEGLRSKPAAQVQPDATVKPWKNFGEMRQLFEQVREQVGETLYREELERAGVQSPGQFQSASRALDCYGRLPQIAAQPEVA
jgi:hypothetical protein